MKVYGTEAEPEPGRGPAPQLSVTVLLPRESRWSRALSSSLRYHERVLQPVGLRCDRLRPGPHAVSVPPEGDLQGEQTRFCKRLRGEEGFAREPAAVILRDAQRERRRMCSCMALK